jgi:hypothetical protein
MTVNNSKVTLLIDDLIHRTDIESQKSGEVFNFEGY